MTVEAPRPTIEPSAVVSAEPVLEVETVDPLIAVLAQIVKIILEEEQRVREQTA